MPSTELPPPPAPPTDDNRDPKNEQQPRVRKNFAETIKIADVKTSRKA